jgi:hypothetical protein
MVDRRRPRPRQRAALDRGGVGKRLSARGVVFCAPVTLAQRLPDCTMGLVIESHTSPASARRRVLRRIALAAPWFVSTRRGRPDVGTCSPRRPRAPRPSPGRAQAPLPDSDGAGERVSRQDRVDEERAGTDRVPIARIEHHALAPTQRQHRVAHRRQRCPLPDLRSERYYVGRRPCDWQVSVVIGADVEPLAHTGYRSDATFDWAISPLARLSWRSRCSPAAPGAGLPIRSARCPKAT